ncbi:MAG: flagellar export chaperone FliS [Bryobacterales bacterium]
MYAQQYVENELMEKSPVELIRLLYSKSLEKLDQAIRHTQSGEVRERNSCLARVMEIVAEFQGTLNLESGGDLALELARLYDYIQRRMIDAAGDPKAVAPLEEARVLLANLYEGWNECDPPAGAGADQPLRNETPRQWVADDIGEASEGRFVDEKLHSPLAPAEYSDAGDGRVWTL